LDDVRGIDARGEPPIEPEGYHPTKAVPMPGQELLAGGRIAAADAFEQLFGIRRARGHDGNHLLRSTLRVDRNFHRGSRRMRRFFSEVLVSVISYRREQHAR
jgi:hypothetical protein